MSDNRSGRRRRVSRHRCVVLFGKSTVRIESAIYRTTSETIRIYIQPAGVVWDNWAPVDGSLGARNDERH